MENSISEKDKAKKIEAVMVTLESLLNIGFKYHCSKYTPCKVPAGESYEFSLKSGNDVSVVFTFYPAFGDKGDYIVAYVIDENTNKDFSLDTWIQERGVIFRPSPFNLSCYEGDFEQQLKEFVEFLNTLFNEPELKPVLEGKSWIDVNFNWGITK